MSEIIGHGIDLLECRRIAELAQKYDRRFLERIFTKAELEYCRARKRQWEHLAGRFAVKEAVLKAIGTGWRGKIAWTDIEVANEKSGKPEIKLSGQTRQIADKQNIDHFLISITHTKDHAMASAIAVRSS